MCDPDVISVALSTTKSLICFDPNNVLPILTLSAFYATVNAAINNQHHQLPLPAFLQFALQ